MDQSRVFGRNILNDIKLHDLVEIEEPEAVFEEVAIILQLISPGFDLKRVGSAFRIILRIYRGHHALYRACTTRYHDLRHTTDAFLATARLAHGAILSKEDLLDRDIIVALVAALFHDTGYIQDKSDSEGTGAKFTLYHVQRSMDFLSRHGPEIGLSTEEITDGATMILYTDIKSALPSSLKPSPTVELLGRLLNAVDLMGQMADRVYLEKLIFLYHEYKEGHVGEYESEVDLIRKTPAFMDYVNQRIAPVSDLVNRFMTAHFSSRWGVSANLYKEAIERQKEYLQKILADPDADPRESLNRYGLAKNTRGFCVTG
ncbi:MAG: hypothetical protein JW836_08305 [Deltaproteobacteria bacterium]|nr:hypothetical protein [Deltaproteobacteria bacterium]